MLTVPGLVKSVLCLMWLLKSCAYTLCMYSGEICKNTEGHELSDSARQKKMIVRECK